VHDLVHSAEDELRRAIILDLMCHMHINLDELEARCGRANLAKHLAAEWHELEPFAGEGLCVLAPRRLDVTPRGRLFLRPMAMVFDEYLRRKRSGEKRFSQTV